MYEVGGPSKSYNMTESLMPSDAEKLLLNIIEEAGSTGIWYEFLSVSRYFISLILNCFVGSRRCGPRVACPSWPFSKFWKWWRARRWSNLPFWCRSVGYHFSLNLIYLHVRLMNEIKDFSPLFFRLLRRRCFSCMTSRLCHLSLKVPPGPMDRSTDPGTSSTSPVLATNRLWPSPPSLRPASSIFLAASTQYIFNNLLFIFYF